MKSLARLPGRVEPKTPILSVLEVLRRHEADFRRRHRLDPVRAHVLDQLLSCRTPAACTHLCVCESCGWCALMCNSCGNRHCPQCQGQATGQWLQARQRKLLVLPHFQVVFTLPAGLRSIAYANQRVVYDLLFDATASVLQELAAQRLGVRLGMTAVLHTWTTDLRYHPHVHFLVTAGGLSLDDERWVPTRDDYLFPQKVLGKMVRGRFLQGLVDAKEAGELTLPGDPDRAAKDFASFIAKARRRKHCIVHVEAPKGRSVDQVTKDLARYVKRVALSDHRLREVTDTHVTLSTRRGPVILDGVEFVRHFLLHVLPHRFRKVRDYGLYAPANAKLRMPRARSLLADFAHEPTVELDNVPAPEESPEAPAEPCPHCGKGPLRHIYPDPPVRRILTFHDILELLVKS